MKSNIVFSALWLVFHGFPPFGIVKLRRITSSVKVISNKICRRLHLLKYLGSWDNYKKNLYTAFNDKISNLLTNNYDWITKQLCGRRHFIIIGYYRMSYLLYIFVGNANLQKHQDLKGRSWVYGGRGFFYFLRAITYFCFSYNQPYHAGQIGGNRMFENLQNVIT